MSTQTPIKVTIETTIQSPLENVWNLWSDPKAITVWSVASPDWHTPTAEVDFKVGGKFNSRMEAKDGSMGFDFWGVYDMIEPHSAIDYTLGDGRKVTVRFSENGGSTHVVQVFEAETENPVEMQQFGWQAILDNFKTYVESQSK